MRGAGPARGADSDELQPRLGEGPCADSILDEVQVSVSDLGAEHGRSPHLDACRPPLNTRRHEPDKATFARMAAQRPGPRSANAAPAWSLLNAIPQAVAICADDWTILYVNRAAALLLDRTVESLIGTLIWEAVPEARRVEFRERIVRAAESSSDTEPQQLPADHALGHGQSADHAWRVGDQVAVLFARVTQRRPRKPAGSV